MKNTLKRSLVLILVLATLISAASVCAISASAANYTTNYGQFTTPSGADFARWNGSKTVKDSNTTKNDIKWMQAALNYCVQYENLNTSFIDVDGSFGPASKTATIAFQKATGLSQDGSFGPNTVKKMLEVIKDGKVTFAKSTSQPTTASNMVSPVAGRILKSPFQPYYRQDVTSTYAHSGVDYVSNSKNYNIYCFYNGVVTAIGKNSSTGNYIEIKHEYNGKTFYSYYFHLKDNSTKVKVGDKVNAGVVIATMGSTGKSSGDHLHFQITSASVRNKDGSFHVLPKNNNYKSWSKDKQSQIVSLKSPKNIIFYNPEIVLRDGISVITGK